MPSEPRTAFLDLLKQRYGAPRKIGGSQSLFEVGQPATRIYVRYSKVHPRGQTFFGLRVEELRQLEGHPSFIAFLWDGQPEPLLLPFDEFEDVLGEAKPATDGQIKAQLYVRDAGTELYISRMGRYKVDSAIGWQRLDAAVSREPDPVPPLNHPQVQSLLGAIGVAKNFDVWIPLHDRSFLDWSICNRFECASQFSMSDTGADFVLQEIDVLWLERGSGRIKSAYEVEHSTTIYSGLLRLNDAHLVVPGIESFGIVADEARRSVFARHLRRPTFLASGLGSICSFLEYPDVYRWHQRISTGASDWNAMQMNDS